MPEARPMWRLIFRWRCFDVWMYRYWMYWFINVLIYDLSDFGCTDVWMYWCMDVPICGCTDFGCMNVMINKGGAINCALLHFVQRVWRYHNYYSHCTKFINPFDNHKTISILPIALPTSYLKFATSDVYWHICFAHFGFSRWRGRFPCYSTMT